MRYKISKDVTIKSENAAKPAAQKSQFLKSILLNLPHVSSSLDFGCGKLRYANEILRATDSLVVCDSEIQLSRTQKLDNQATTIRDIYKRSNRVRALNDVELAASGIRFDRSFCINVLSVIPIYARRLQAIDLIMSTLNARGSSLFVVQYRNSDFTRMSAMPNATPWRDGFIIDSLRGHSFYGLIKPDALVAMLTKVGFQIVSTKLKDGSVYVWARK